MSDYQSSNWNVLPLVTLILGGVLIGISWSAWVVYLGLATMLGPVLIWFTIRIIQHDRRIMERRKKTK